MKLYDYYRSSSSYRVRIALNLKQISYEKLPIHLLHNGGEQFSEDYLKFNPQGLVPTLNENGHVLTQSLAILDYLEEICPEPALLPVTPLGRAQVRSMALLIACDIQPLNNLRILKQLREQFDANEDQIRTWYHHWLKLGFDAFEAKLHQIPHKHPFCYGNEPTLADVCLIPQVFNAKRFGFAMDNYPLIQEIDQHCLNVPAFKHAMPMEN